MKKIALIVSIPVLALLLVSCNDKTTPPSAQAKAIERAKTRANYVPKNDVEGQNYNKRQEISDDPSTILWCTTSIGSTPSAPLITVPIVGKLTSGNKRPFPTQVAKQYDTSGSYNPELPGTDGFYGSSGDYRYGFRPDGTYVEFYGTQTYCTTEPTTFQREKTLIDLGTNSTLSSATSQAEARLRAGDTKGAQALLEKAAGK